MTNGEKTMNRKERRAKHIAVKEPTINVKLSDLRQGKVPPVIVQAIQHEANLEYIKAKDQISMDIDAACLWALHQAFGFGYDRLKRFYIAVGIEHSKLAKHYETDGTYPERHLLETELRINLNDWSKELYEKINKNPVGNTDCGDSNRNHDCRDSKG